MRRKETAGSYNQLNTKTIICYIMEDLETLTRGDLKSIAAGMNNILYRIGE